MSDYRNFKEVIAAFPDQLSLAIEIGEKRATIAKWAQRDSVPPRCWPSIVEAARRFGITGVNLRLFATFKEARGYPGLR